MEKGQTLPQLTSKLPLPLDKTLESEQPDLVLAQGDTTTAFMVSLACFYQKIAFGHVEAGLRTMNPYYPFPEETNRVLISRLTTLHFAPTETAKKNLINEGCPQERIYFTGNTVIDSLYYILNRKISTDPRIQSNKRLILATVHRRDNFGEKLHHICRAFRTIADRNPDVQIVLPVHPNPNVCHVIHQELDNHPQLLLTPPLNY